MYCSVIPKGFSSRSLLQTSSRVSSNCSNWSWNQFKDCWQHSGRNTEILWSSKNRSSLCCNLILLSSIFSSSPICYILIEIFFGSILIFLCKLQPAYYNLGVVYSEMMQYDMALNCYEKAALERPMYAEAYCNMGVIYKNRGDLESAIACYERYWAKHLQTCCWSWLFKLIMLKQFSYSSSLFFSPSGV